MLLQRRCRFDNNVAGFGNNAEATFDFVERIVRLVAFDSVASTLLLVWTGLNAHRCSPIAVYIAEYSKSLGGWLHTEVT